MFPSIQKDRVSIYNNPDLRGNIVLNPFNLNWNFLHAQYHLIE